MTNRDLHVPKPEKGSSNRAFGLVFAAFFLVIGFVPRIHGYHGPGWSFALSAVFAILALAKPDILTPLNRWWTKFGLALHAIVSPIALGIIFFGVVTPTGLLARLFGKGSQWREFDRSAETYWIARTPSDFTRESFKDQF